MLDDQVLSRITGTVYRGGIERISTREILQVLCCSERETKLPKNLRPRPWPCRFPKLAFEPCCRVHSRYKIPVPRHQDQKTTYSPQVRSGWTGPRSPRIPGTSSYSGGLAAPGGCPHSLTLTFRHCYRSVAVMLPVRCRGCQRPLQVARGSSAPSGECRRPNSAEMAATCPNACPAAISVWRSSRPPTIAPEARPTRQLSRPLRCHFYFAGAGDSILDPSTLGNANAVLRVAARRTPAR